MFDRELSISEVCSQAADLIVKDGFVIGGEGWHGSQGWCIEGALGKVMGVPMDSRLTHRVNYSPAAQAIKSHLGLPELASLHFWNDRNNMHTVVRVLKEVAASHNSEPVVTEPVKVAEPVKVGVIMATWLKVLGWNKPIKADNEVDEARCQAAAAHIKEFEANYTKEKIAA